VFEDDRGRLTLVDLDQVPFVAERAYVLNAIPKGKTRGGHASRTQARALVCVSGQGRVTLDDGHATEAVELDVGAMVHVPASVWHEIEALDEELSILVLAEGGFDPADYAERSELPLTASQTRDA
jgi:quercetin dioxygenase-like cupin family protein